MNFNHQCSDPCAVLHPKAVLGDVGVVSRGRGIKTFITETYTTQVIMTTIVTIFMILDPMVIQGVANNSLGETVTHKPFHEG